MLQIIHQKLKSWLFPSIVLITIGFGWKYRWIAFIVPVVMLLGIGSLLLQQGRHFCGNYCPRGAFYDSFVQPLSKKRKIPKFLRNKVFRWVVLILLFGLFLLQAARSPFTTAHFGLMFWMMCTVTTVLGIILGIFFSHRTWCAFCPIGTLVSSIGKDRHALIIDKNTCVNCKLCGKVCPLNIHIKSSTKDCIKCGKCIAVCPKKSLGFR